MRTENIDYLRSKVYLKVLELDIMKTESEENLIERAVTQVFEKERLSSDNTTEAKIKFLRNKVKDNKETVDEVFYSKLKKEIRWERFKYRAKEHISYPISKDNLHLSTEGRLADKQDATYFVTIYQSFFGWQSFYTSALDNAKDFEEFAKIINEVIVDGKFTDVTD